MKAASDQPPPAIRATCIERPWRRARSLVATAGSSQSWACDSSRPGQLEVNSTSSFGRETPACGKGTRRLVNTAFRRNGGVGSAGRTCASLRVGHGAGPILLAVERGQHGQHEEDQSCQEHFEQAVGLLDGVQFLHYLAHPVQCGAVGNPLSSGERRWFLPAVRTLGC